MHRVKISNVTMRELLHNCESLSRKRNVNMNNEILPTVGGYVYTTYATTVSFEVYETFE